MKNSWLKWKLNKCQFKKDTVNYLGHIVSTDGIEPDPTKIDSIADYKIPISVEEVRSFLGLTVYYRRFIKNFGSITQPLTAKTHKNALKKLLFFTNIDQEVFENLRTCLITPP